MKVLVVGNEDWTDCGPLVHDVLKIVPYDIDKVLLLFCLGVGEHAFSFARNRKINISFVSPQWERYGSLSLVEQMKEACTMADAVVIVRRKPDFVTGFVGRYAKRNRIPTFKVEVTQ